MNSKFLGLSAQTLTVDYMSYNPKQDLDKQVWEAAQKTADGNYSIDTV